MNKEELKILIEADDRLVKTFTLDLTCQNSIKIKNCNNCLITCCDNPSDTEWFIPLTKKEKLFLNMEYLILPPKNIKKTQEEAVTNKANGIRYKDICEFSSNIGCTLQTRPLHCQIFPYLLYNDEIVLSIECFLYKNSSKEDIKKGAKIAKKLFLREDKEYLIDTSKVNEIDRLRYISKNKDYISTGVYL
jgi:hypothetical protein